MSPQYIRSLRRKPEDASGMRLRSPFEERPFAQRRSRLSGETPVPQGAGTIQRALAEMAEEAEDGGYAEIRTLVGEYNQKLDETPADVIQHLHRLDQIDQKGKTWLTPFLQEPLENEAPDDFRKWTRIRQLREQVKGEKTSLLTGPSVTEGAQVLAGPEAALQPVSVWSIDAKNDGNWEDMSGLLTKARAVTITGSDNGDWLFTVEIEEQKYKGRAKKDQVTLGTRFRDQSQEQLYPEGTPKPEEVLQSNLGDCYLQAALASLAAQKPTYITGQMIYDAGDRVVVRLYDPPNYTAKNVSVEKSVPETTGGQELYNRGALWVRMVQKAYVASGLGRNAVVDAGPTLSYKDIAGPGKLPGYAMGVLLGNDVTSHSASGESLQEEQFEEAKFPWTSDIGTYLLYQDMQRIPGETDQGAGQYEAARKLLGALFGDVESNMVAWARFADDNQSDLAGFRGIKQFNDFFDEEALDENLAGPVLAWVKNSGFYRGTVGSGVYSRGQLSLLGKIEAALSQHRVVVTGTNQKPPKKAQDSGGSGEPMYQGLAFGHAYTVLAVRRDVSSNPESDEEGPHAWVKIRNPWGRYGRVYDVEQDGWPAQAANDQGTFWVELNDFASNFHEVQIG